METLDAGWLNGHTPTDMDVNVEMNKSPSNAMV